MTVEMNSLILAIVPLLGGLLSIIFWSKPEKVKLWLILVTIISLISVFILSDELKISTGGQLLLYLLPIAAFISLVVHLKNRDDQLSFLMTVILLGLGFGVLTNQGITGQIVLMVLLGLLTYLIYRYRNPIWSSSWISIGIFTVATISVGVSNFTDTTTSLFISLLVSSILLPLLPLQFGYIATITRLPGSLPSFTVVLLPVLGLNNLAAVLTELSSDIAYSLSILALISVLYGTAKAIVQTRVPLIVAYSSLAFFSILWWFLASSQAVTIQNVIFLVTVAIVTSGFLISWQIVCRRYGDDVDMRAVYGLAWSMPQFAVFLTLIALAAMGMPPFGVFAGFLGMLFTTSYASYIPLIFILIAWLAASWYIMDMVQKLIFGEKQAEIRVISLHSSEYVSLLIVVLIAVALGVLPSDIFGV